VVGVLIGWIISFPIILYPNKLIKNEILRFWVLRSLFKGRLTQVVDRILRPAEGKKPLVIDFIDARLKYRAKQRWK